MCVCAKVSIPIVLRLRGSTGLLPTTTANHESIVWPCGGAPHTGHRSPYVQLPPTPVPLNSPQGNKTHIECGCALPPPTDQPHASPETHLWVCACECVYGMAWHGMVWCGVVRCGVVWCAEGAVTKRQWPAWSCTREHASPQGCVSKCALCVVRCAPVAGTLSGTGWLLSRAALGTPRHSARRCYRSSR